MKVGDKLDLVGIDSSAFKEGSDLFRVCAPFACSHCFVQGSFEGKSLPVRSFCSRAVSAANAATAGSLAAGPSSSSQQPQRTGDSVADLIREIRREETRVHVPIAERVEVRDVLACVLLALCKVAFSSASSQGLAIKSLAASCLPNGEIVDDCHNRTLKLRKKAHNDKLFVYHEVTQFLPLQFKGVSHSALRVLLLVSAWHQFVLHLDPQCGRLGGRCH